MAVGAWNQERWRARREDHQTFRRERLEAYSRLSASCTEFVSDARSFTASAQRVDTALKAAFRQPEVRSTLSQASSLDSTVARVNDSLATCRLVASDDVLPILDPLAAVALEAAELTRSGSTEPSDWDEVLDRLRSRRSEFESAVRRELRPPALHRGLRKDG